MKDYLDLFSTFIKIGASTFGGYAIIPVLDRELIRKKGWITMDEVMDYFTIAQVTPGIIAINVSTFVGFKRKGIAGGIIATLGFALPGITLMILIAFFISSFSDYKAVQHAFAGIRLAVGALILNTVFKLVKGFYKEIKSVVLFVLAFSVSALFGKSPVYIILGAGFLGWLFFRPKNHGQKE